MSSLDLLGLTILTVLTVLLFLTLIFLAGYFWSLGSGRAFNQTSKEWLNERNNNSNSSNQDDATKAASRVFDEYIKDPDLARSFDEVSEEIYTREHE